MPWIASSAGRSAGSARWRAGSAGGRCSRSAGSAGSAPRPAPACVPARSCACRGSRPAACACRGGAAARTARSLPASSTSRPRYITPTRSAHVAHDRQVVRDEEVGQPLLALQVLHDVEHLRLHGDVERRGRLVADQELGLASPARARSRCAGAARRRTGAGTCSTSAAASPTDCSSCPTRVRLAPRLRRADACPCSFSGSPTMSATFQRGFRLAYGSWKIIWMRRRSAGARLGRRHGAILAVEHDLAARRRIEADEQAGHRALAAAGFADQRERPALPMAKLDAVDRLQQLARAALDHAVQPRRRDVEGLGQVPGLHQRRSFGRGEPACARRKRGVEGGTHATAPACASCNQHAAWVAPARSRPGRSSGQRSNARGQRGW